MAQNSYHRPGSGDNASSSDSYNSASVDKGFSRVFRPDKDANIITLRCPRNKTPHNKYCQFTLLIPSEQTEAAHDNNNNDDNNKGREAVGGDEGYNNNNNDDDDDDEEEEEEVTLIDNNNNNNNNINYNIKVVKLDDRDDHVIIGSCVICFDKPIRSLYFPCGHLNSCYQCAVKVYLSQSNCPFCNTPVRKVVKAYFDCDKK